MARSSVSADVPPDLLWRVRAIETAHANGAGCYDHCGLIRMLAADLWVYPIPFSCAWGLVPHSLFVGVFFLAAVGRKRLREKPRLLHELAMIYPAYNAVYLRLGPWQQTMFVPVLPLL